MGEFSNTPPIKEKVLENGTNSVVCKYKDDK